MAGLMFIWLKISLPEHPPDSLLAFLHEKPLSLIETLFFFLQCLQSVVLKVVEKNLLLDFKKWAALSFTGA